MIRTLISGQFYYQLIRAGLQRAYERMLVAVSSHTTWGEDALGVAFGAIAHTAYHLGAIRQRLTPRGRNP